MTLLSKIGFCIAIIFTHNVTSALEVSVGRATAVLPQGKWEVLTDEKSGIGFSGDLDGTIQSNKKLVALINEKSEILALISFEASRGGVGQGTMSWTGGCKQSASQSYHFDFTKGSLDQMNCLRTWSNTNTVEEIDALDPKANTALKNKGYKLPSQMHAIVHFVTTANGSFFSTVAFIGQNISNAETVTTGADKSLSTEPLASWSMQMAEAATSSLRSFSGAYKVPALFFLDAKK